MLRFVSKDNFLEEYANLSEEERECAGDFLTVDEAGDGIGFAYSHGCIILRYFDTDEGYFFSAPYALTEEADIGSAYAQASEYCRLEEIPEMFVDVAEEELDLAKRGAKDADVYQNEEGTYTVRIFKPTELCDDLPEALCKEVYIGEFAEKYAADYERLVKNVNLNRYFGYNLTDDLPNGTGTDFIRFVRDEFASSRSMTFAATVLLEGENLFVGEGCLFGFDGRGSARVSFRVLPEYQRRGYGGSILGALISVGRELGLDRLVGEVFPENAPSRALLDRFASGEAVEDKIVYTISIE